ALRAGERGREIGIGHAMRADVLFEGAVDRLIEGHCPALSNVTFGLAPNIPKRKALLCLYMRDGRDKPGHDAVLDGKSERQRPPQFAVPFGSVEARPFGFPATVTSMPPPNRRFATRLASSMVTASISLSRRWM